MELDELVGDGRITIEIDPYPDTNLRMWIAAQTLSGTTGHGNTPSAALMDLLEALRDEEDES